MTFVIEFHFQEKIVLCIIIIPREKRKIRGMKKINDE
jgi:hypothetical protein